MKTPTLRQLEYIVALADTGQFGEAARKCAVSQPALSKQIKTAEEVLGVQIFERTRPRVIPTQSGEEIIRRAQSILKESRELMDVAASFSGSRKGTLRLGVIPTIAPYGLPGFLAKLRRRYPDVSFAIEELQTDVLLDQLRAGAIDLGLLARPFDDHAIVGPDLIVEPFVLVAPTGHLLSSPDARIKKAEMVGASLILMEDGHCLRDQAIEVCALAGTPPATSVTAASVATLVRMVESGLGATLLPTSALSTEFRSEQGLVARSFGKAPPSRTITIQWRATSPHDDWFTEIGDALRDHYLELNETVPEIGGPKPKIISA